MRLQHESFLCTQPAQHRELLTCLGLFSQRWNISSAFSPSSNRRPWWKRSQNMLKLIWNLPVQRNCRWTWGSKMVVTPPKSSSSNPWQPPRSEGPDDGITHLNQSRPSQKEFRRGDISLVIDYWGTFQVSRKTNLIQTTWMRMSQNIVGIGLLFEDWKPWYLFF